MIKTPALSQGRNPRPAWVQPNIPALPARAALCQPPHKAHTAKAGLHFSRGRQVMLGSETSLKGHHDWEFPKTGHWTTLTIQHSVNAYPSSVIPSMNSSFENSHCVAARNFHAMMSTVMLAGSRARSSQNCCIPSIPILFSSCGSLGHKSKYQEKQVFEKADLFNKYV